MHMELTTPPPGAPDPGVALADAPAAPARSNRRELTRLFLVLLALTFVLRMPAFFTPVFNSDETFLATQAHVLNDGGQLYEEAIDRKPPIVPYVYAATFTFFETSALWSVRVVAMLAVALTALLLAIEARRRYGSRAGWIAGVMFVVAMVLFAPQDGQAANFEVFMLPSMTAAILFARRGRGFLAGVAIALATLAKQTGAATLLPVVYLIMRSRGKKGVGEVALGFTIPTALVALAVGPSQLLYWTVLGNGSYVGMKTMSTVVLTTFLFMTGMWALCNLPLLWKIPSAWGHRKLVALDGQRDTDLWLWVLSAAVSVAVGLRFFGHYYIQLAPPLALLAAGAIVRGTRKWADRAVAFALVVGVLFSAAGYFFRPGVPEPSYESVSALPGHHHGPRRRHLRLGQRARDLLGVGSPAGDALPHLVLPDRELPRSTARRRQHQRRHRGRVARLLHRLHRAPTEVLRRHRTRQRARRAVLPDLELPAPREDREDPVPPRRHHRRHRGLPAQVAPAPPAAAQTSGQGVLW